MGITSYFITDKMYVKFDLITLDLHIVPSIFAFHDTPCVALVRHQKESVLQIISNYVAFYDSHVRYK